MTTEKIIRSYFDSLRNGSGWEAFLADDMRFTSFTNPGRVITGKNAYIQATKGFYSMIVGSELRELIVNNSRACALTRYKLQPPGGAVFESDVAEIFSVTNDKIVSFGIYFDTAPFPKPPKK